MGFRNRIVRLSQLVADQITGGTIVGATIETALNGNRWVLAGAAFRSLIQGFTGDPAETNPIKFTADASLLGSPRLRIEGPTTAGVVVPASIQAVANGATGLSELRLLADGLFLNNTTPIKQIAFGVQPITATAVVSANQAIAPGFTPTVIVATAIGTAQWFANDSSLNPPVLVLVKRDGVAATATINVAWIALA